MLIDAADRLAGYAAANTDRTDRLDVNLPIVKVVGAIAANGLIRMIESR